MKLKFRLENKIRIIAFFLLLFSPFSIVNASPYSINDQYLGEWYLQKIKAEFAWQRANNYKDVVIAIIDSGVQIDHPDLRANIWSNPLEIPNNNKDDDNNGYIDDINGWDFVSSTNDPSPKIEGDYFIADEVTHGTVVAGLAAAVGGNGIGVSGVAPQAKIMPLRVLDAKGIGSIDSVIRAIDYAIKNKADIINLSFAASKSSANLEFAIRRAKKAGILVVAAAGNSQEAGPGPDLNTNPMYPVCNDGYLGEDNVFGVAASDSLDQKVYSSGYGSDCVDITAPGVSMFSTSFYSPNYKNGENVLHKYYDGYWSGTSMATPLVSGAAALVLATNPSLDLEELVYILKASSDYIEKLNPDYIGQLGAGRLNLEKAVSMANKKLTENKSYLLKAKAVNGDGNIFLSDFKNQNRSQIKVFDDYKGGVHIASGDLDGDGKEDIVVGAGPGGGPQVQVYSSDGKLITQFFAYNKNFRGGVSVAVGDINGDGIDDIVTGAGPGGGPHIRVFNLKAELLGQFFAYDENFKGGLSVAVGDVNGDSQNEIISGAGIGGGPQVRAFNRYGKVLSQFFAYDENFRGGINVAVADIDGGLRKLSEIVVSPMSKGGPHIRIFDNYGRVISQFFAYSRNYKGGLSIALADLDQDGQKEIVTAPLESGTAHVRYFEVNGKLLGAFFAYPEDYIGGLNITTINLK